ncbi:MAG TPA: M23 family metallopeptidase [Pyrinomonadaceae bacterium]|jgi:murein DD-endopeptidase MepM/ murein hydrolase activator NlpD
MNLQWPVNVHTPSPRGKFGWRQFPGQSRTFHHGVDLPVVTGTPVRAAAAGVVTAAVWRKTSGWSLTINHGSGIETRYYHLSRFDVSHGQSVAQGQVVAHSGNTGSSTRGPHLHFMLLLNGRAVDPIPFLRGGSVTGGGDVAPGGDAVSGALDAFGLGLESGGYDVGEEEGLQVSSGVIAFGAVLLLVLLFS